MSKRNSQSSWAPLSVPLFRNLWIAALIADTGIWTHDMAASWLMTSTTSSPLLISLMQGAANLPYFLLAFPAGVFADVFNQRTMLMITALFIALVTMMMGLLAFNVNIEPWMLLLYVFAIGAGNAFYDPIWKGVVPQLVRPELQTAAFGLDGVSVNLARALGPAIAGLLISIYSPSTALWFSSLSFCVLAILLTNWKPEARIEKKFSFSSFRSSLRTGIQFARYSPPVLKILGRTFLFLVPGSVMWALLPLIGRQEMKLSAGEYGTLVAAVGLGAILAISFMSKMKSTLGVEKSLLIASIGFMINLATLAFVQRFEILCFTMILAGSGWIIVLSSLQASILPAAPKWVRGRVIALYSLTFFGSVSVGSILWGLIAENSNAQTALSAALGAMIISSLVGYKIPLPSSNGMEATSTLDTDCAMYPEVSLESEGPVVVTVEYTISQKSSPEFMESILEIGRMRRKNGAYQWGLFENTDDSSKFTERFMVSSHSEFSEQRSRLTQDDRLLLTKLEIYLPVSKYYRMKEIL